MRAGPQCSHHPGMCVLTSHSTSCLHALLHIAAARCPSRACHAFPLGHGPHHLTSRPRASPHLPCPTQASQPLAHSQSCPLLPPAPSSSPATTSCLKAAVRPCHWALGSPLLLPGPCYLGTSLCPKTPSSHHISAGLLSPPIDLAGQPSKMRPLVSLEGWGGWGAGTALPGSMQAGAGVLGGHLELPAFICGGLGASRIACPPPHAVPGPLSQERQATCNHTRHGLHGLLVSLCTVLTAMSLLTTAVPAPQV